MGKNQKIFNSKDIEHFVSSKSICKYLNGLTPKTIGFFELKMYQSSYLGPQSCKMRSNIGSEAQKGGQNQKILSL